MPRKNAMMQRWGGEAVRFMRDASEYGNYHAQLVQKLLPYLPKEGHVCDAGCGLGYLSLELSKYCRQVTAVDASEAALHVLREKHLPENLQIRHGDIFSMQASYDAVVFCYFGHTDEILRLAKTQCKGNVLVVKRDCSQHLFSLGSVARKPHSVERLCEILEQKSVSYHAEHISLELGQPFRNVEDAVSFFELYNKSNMQIGTEQVKQMLRAMDSDKFPWYLPSQRDMELIVFSAEDVRE